MGSWTRIYKRTNQRPKPTVNQQRWLVVAPHADDEVFAVPIIVYARSLMISMDILILGASSRRKEEAELACQHLNINVMLACDMGFTGVDGCYHERMINLVDIICETSYQYDKVLAPALEGGHQDHDTAWLAVALADAINKTNKGLYYRTYTAIGKHGLFVTSPVNSSYCPDIFKVFWKSKRLIYVEQIYLASIIYKSQWRTWIMLVVGLLIKWARGGMHHEVIACKCQDFDNLSRSLEMILGKDCLFEIHGRMSQSEWRTYALEAVMLYNHQNFSSI